MSNQPPAPEYKRCKNCGKVIGAGKNSKREYCNAACKQEAYRKRKGAGNAQ